MTDNVFPLRQGTRRLDSSLIPTERSLVGLFNTLRRTHPQLRTLEVSVNVDIETVTPEMPLVAFSIRSTAPASPSYNLHPATGRTLSDKLQARIAKSPAEWKRVMGLVAELRDADERMEEMQVMRAMRTSSPASGAMRTSIPASELGNLSMDFLANCGGFDIDMSR
jgi:hypothetical protein